MSYPEAFNALQTVTPQDLADALKNDEIGYATGYMGQCLAIPGNYCYDPDGKDCAACPIAQSDHEVLAAYIRDDKLGTVSTSSHVGRIETSVTITQTRATISFIHENGGYVRVTSTVPTDT